MGLVRVGLGLGLVRVGLVRVGLGLGLQGATTCSTHRLKASRPRRSLALRKEATSSRLRCRRCANLVRVRARVTVTVMVRVRVRVGARVRVRGWGWG